MKIAVIDDAGFGFGKPGLFGKELYVELLAKVNEDVLGNEVTRILLGNPSDNERIVSVIGSRIPIIRTFEDRTLKQELETILRNKKIDIIHVNVLNARYPRNIVTSAKNLSIPIVTTVHNWTSLCPSGWAVKLPEQIPCENLGLQMHCIKCLQKLAGLYKINRVGRLTDGLNLHYSLRSLLRNSGAVISPSKSLGESITQKMDIKRICILPNLLPEELINMEPTYGGEKEVAFYGRLTYEKGIHLVSDMARRLPEVTFNVMGAGPLEENVRKSSIEYKNIVYHGFVSNVKKVEIIRRCRAVIMPILWFEAFGYTVAEAFSLGKPVIGFALGGVKEMIEDSGAGFAVNPFDLGKLINCLDIVVRDANMSAELGRKGKNYVFDYLKPSLFAERLESIYETVLVR